jgi:protein-S-isoprenylcysteine O-methyltransferase Ste14
MHSPLQVLAVAVLAWWVSWLAAAAWRSKTVGGPGVAAQLPYRLLVIAGVVLLFGFSPALFAAVPLWHLAPWLAWVMCGLGIIGLLFTWWARVHLGRLWSGVVTRKADHHVVDTGPYGIVRHPIYTGLTLTGLALALMRATLGAVAGAAVLTLGWYVKARLEERFLREQLGAGPYNDYARRVPMMVPFWRSWRRRPLDAAGSS